MNKFYLNFEFYLHVEKSSEVQLRKEKIKASLNFFISFLSRDFETFKFDVNSISMKLSVYEMRQEKFLFVLRIEAGVKI